MDIISVSNFDPFGPYERFNGKKPDFIKVKVPIDNNAIEDYFDIIDWSHFDVRLLFDLPLDLVRQIVFEGRIHYSSIISSLKSYFLEQGFNAGASILMIESLRCFQESGKRDNEIHDDIYQIVNRFSKNEEFSQVVFQSLISIKLVYETSNEIDYLLKVAHRNAIEYGNTTLSSMIEGESPYLHINPPHHENVKEFEDRIAIELAHQYRENREREERETADRERGDVERRSKKIKSSKDFWKATLLMLLIYCVSVPVVVSSIIVYMIYGSEFNERLISFTGVQIIGGALYVLIGGLIYKFKIEENIDILSRLYKIWILTGCCTSILKLIIDILAP